MIIPNNIQFDVHREIGCNGINCKWNTWNVKEKEIFPDDTIWLLWDDQNNNDQYKSNQYS